MDNNFTRAMKFVGKWEWGNREDGGYTNDPLDAGGETKWGISKRAHPNVDIKTLTLAGAAVIYWDEYWKPVISEAFPEAYCVAMFDSAVNCGPGQAKKFGVGTQDFNVVIQRRKDFYASLVERKPSNQRFFKGWIARCVDLQKYCEIIEQG